MSPSGYTVGGRRGDLPYKYLRWSNIFAAAVREAEARSGAAAPGARPLTRAQLRLLQLIAIAGPLQVGDLASRLGVSAAAASKGVNGLEEQGLVLRRRLAGDRRATVLVATASGRQLVWARREAGTSEVAPVLASLGPERAAELCRLLEEASVALLAAGAPGPDPCLRCGGLTAPGCPVAALGGDCPFTAPAAAATGDRLLSAVRQRG